MQKIELLTDLGKFSSLSLDMGLEAEIWAWMLGIVGYEEGEGGEGGE